MRRTCLLPRLALPAVVLGLGTLLPPAHAADAAARPEGAGPAAVAACERAVRQSLEARGARAADLTFSTVPTVQAGLSGDGQTMLRGDVQARAAGAVRTFTFICHVEPRTAEAVGLVIRESTPVAAAAPARRPLEPDLTGLSPAACESSAAEALQRRWPRVSKISFDSDTRRFRQLDEITAEFQGSGRAMPTPGAPLTYFEFGCAIDPRDGQVLETRITGVRGRG